MTHWPSLSLWIAAAEEAEQNSPEQTENTEPEEETPATTTEKQTGYISASSVNVRASASTSAKVITTLTRNTAVTIAGEENGWTRITTSSGVSGYVSSEYISAEQVQSTNRSDRLPYQQQQFEYLDEIPDTAIELDSYNGHEYNKYWYDYDSERVIINTRNKFRFVNSSWRTNSVNLIDIHGHQHMISLNKLQKEMTDRLNLEL